MRSSNFRWVCSEDRHYWGLPPCLPCRESLDTREAVAQWLLQLQLYGRLLCSGSDRRICRMPEPVIETCSGLCITDSAQSLAISSLPLFITVATRHVFSVYCPSWLGARVPHYCGLHQTFLSLTVGAPRHKYIDATRQAERFFSGRGLTFL